MAYSARSENRRPIPREAPDDLLAGTAHEATVLLDRHGLVRHADPASCRLLGYTQDELLGTAIDRLTPDISAELWPQLWEKLHASGGAVRELRHRTRDGRTFPVEISAKYIDYGGEPYALVQVRDISERRREEELRLANLHFFSCMDQVDRTIRASCALETMMQDVLDLVLSQLGCDRAFLLYPCDPDTPTWTVPMERTRSGYPGALDQQAVIPTDEDVAHSFRCLLAAEGPLTFGPGNTHPMVTEIGERFGIRSFMSMAIHPKVGAPWQFGIHQCSRDRVWSEDELRLFQEVGRRIADALSSLLMLRDLRDSELRYRRIVDTANEGICVLGVDDETMFVNPRMARLLGYEPEELLGRRLDDLLSDREGGTGGDGAGDDGTRAGSSDGEGAGGEGAGPGERLTDRLRTGPGQLELCLRHRDGNSVWVLASGAIADSGRAAGPEPQADVGSVVMFTDITAIKRAERELQAVNERLEERVEDRTAQLQASNAQLERAYRELTVAHTRLLQQEKLASIGQLAAGIAHEINTPAQFVGDNLTFLSEGFGELLDLLRAGDGAGVTGTGENAGAGENLDLLVEEVPRALEESADGVARIAGTIRALKDFARTTPEQPQPVDLDRLIRSTVEVSRPEWSRVAGLELHLDPDLPQVIGRRDDLGQALLNLMINAAHAIAAADADGGGRIVVTTRHRRDLVEIDIDDNGCGIPEDLQYRIFEPFFTTGEVGRGRGMGLAIAYDVVTTRHGGELLVRSSPGRGSTFTVRLPSAGPT